MNAVIGRLKTSLKTFSLHAVNCVLEMMDVSTCIRYTLRILAFDRMCLTVNWMTYSLWREKLITLTNRDDAAKELVLQLAELVKTIITLVGRVNRER
ncbi:hypothetical protein KXD40_003845 [Peronospora effusa]|uniref:Uncharacterized protein n=1 Tax=Peronospora effusa TaxID=542832 RepID=A0A3M6VNJ8_9STRA|nr:hypothetical protein DD238_005988 [Peronospora effusa]RQM15118.1 hypothetical protein DD237_006380 [Peronospora effusa]UIZ22771.1 hypothetical protein KXD40_003845 [Peronospora effusa]